MDQNHPRARMVEPILVDQLRDCQPDLLPSKVWAKGSQMAYDPRPLHLWQPDPQAIENLQCDRLTINKPCGLNNVLIPSVDKMFHYHPYSTQSGSVHIQCVYLMRVFLFVVQENLQWYLKIPKHQLRRFFRGYILTAKKKMLEEKTSTHNSNSLWFEARQNRATRSKCGEIIQLKDKKALLYFVLNP